MTHRLWLLTQLYILITYKCFTFISHIIWMDWSSLSFWSRTQKPLGKYHGHSNTHSMIMIDHCSYGKPSTISDHPLSSITIDYIQLLTLFQRVKKSCHQLRLQYTIHQMEGCVCKRTMGVRVIQSCVWFKQYLFWDNNTRLSIRQRCLFDLLTL